MTDRVRIGRVCAKLGPGCQLLARAQEEVASLSWTVTQGEGCRRNSGCIVEVQSRLDWASIRNSKTGGCANWQVGSS